MGSVSHVKPDRAALVPEWGLREECTSPANLEKHASIILKIIQTSISMILGNVDLKIGIS